MTGVRVYEPDVGTEIDTESVTVDGEPRQRQVVRVYRSLTERLLAKAPEDGFSLYLDTADPTYIYIAEGPSSDTGASPTARGIRVGKDASGNLLGRVEVALGFAWDERASAGWS